MNTSKRLTAKMEPNDRNNLDCMTLHRRKIDDVPYVYDTHTHTSETRWSTYRVQGKYVLGNDI